MFVVEVIPLVRGVHIEALSYFSSTNYNIGTVVHIPVRGKTVTGVILHTEPVSSTKTALKAATFSLRKLPPQPTATNLNRHLLTLVDELFQSIPAKRGAILFSLLPPDIKNGAVAYPTLTPSDGSEDPTPQVATGSFAERLIHYQTIIRTAFAHRGSVLLVAPTAAVVRELHQALKQGISDRITCFHGEQGKRSRAVAYEQLLDLSRARLIITTPSFAYLDRPDFSTIVIEAVGSSNYVERTRPYLDHRQALITLARITKRQLILSDTLARTEDEYHRREDRYLTYGEHQRRLNLPATLTIVEQHDKPKGDVPFSLFSPELKKRIETTLEGRHNVFLYAARRGLSPVVACVDCGHIFRCPDSGAPYSLLRTHHPTRGEERWFIASTSGKRVRASDVCTNCGSWRLRERGIGLQYIEDEVKKLFPSTKRLIMDATTASTPKKALALKHRMEEERGAIMIGTSVALSHFPEHIYLSAITSLDAARSIPTWRADESLFRLLLTLREYSSHEVMVQTRSTPDDLLHYAARGATDRFHDDEITLRRMVQYPPFTTFYLLTWQGAAAHITATETLIKQLIAPLATKAQFYTNPQSHTDKPIRHCLIRSSGSVPDTNIIETLRHVPPYVSVMVNPDRIV